MRKSLSDSELMRYVRMLRQRVIGMTGRPVHFVLDRYETQTAATDCQRTVTFNPRPLEQDPPLLSVSLGMVSHEAGHINNSPQGSILISKAHERSGETLAYIVNLLFDRKDDHLTRRDFPGVVSDMNARLPYISPRASREEKTKNLYVDFFCACKIGARPQTAVVFQCMKIIRKGLRNYRRLGENDILDTAERILNLLRKHGAGDIEEQCNLEYEFRQMVEKMARAEQANKPLTNGERKRLLKIIAQVESEDDEALFPISTDEGKEGDNSGSSKYRQEIARFPKEETVPPCPLGFNRIFQVVEHLVLPLREKLEYLAPPEVETWRALTEGNPDSTQLARLIVTGDEDIFCEEHLIRNNTVSLAFCGDTSSSMGSPIAKGLSEKVEYVRQLGVLFNAALDGLENLTACSWLFDNIIRNCGSPSLENGVAGATPYGGNCDSAMALRLIQFFEENPADRMMAVFVSDGGPDSFEELDKGLAVLHSMGVITVQFFIESEKERNGEANDKLDRMFRYRFIFDSKSIDNIVGQFANLILKLYQS